MPSSLPLLVDGTPAFDAALDRLRRRGADDLAAVEPAVREIIAGVRASGDEALRRYVEAFERRSPGALVLHAFDGAGALARLEPRVRAALELAARRIESYHRHQHDAATSFRYEEDGVSLGLRVRPLARVGVYAPGGKARYPSSVLMAAIPARIAGVREIVLATPLTVGAPLGEPSSAPTPPAPDDRILAAAHLAGVTAILDAGGAQAIAALAYGTASLPRVDKIVGPGNAYVACAKRLVFGDVAIDGIAGPSEILVLADEGADAAIVAADLLSQAEHDEAAYAVLVTTSPALAEAVARAVSEQLAGLDRRAIAGASIDANAAIFVVTSRERLAEIAEIVAAEHLSLHTDDPEGLLAQIGSAGAALVGHSTPVAAGDYLAGPSHVLPTGGCVRFGSPLGVYDFLARSSVIRYSPDALLRQGPHIAALARAEGLQAHARAVEMRLEHPGQGHRRVGGEAPAQSSQS